MIDWVFLKGAAIGFLIALPVGPVNVLCVRRTLIHGHLAGLVSGLGAAAADTVFGAIAAFGLLVLVDALIAHQRILACVGAGILAVLGTMTLLRPPPPFVVERDPTSLLADFTSTFALTLTNPITVFSFLGVYVAFGIQADGTVDIGDWLLLAGVFAGASLWWLILTTATAAFRSRFSVSGLRWANRVAGFVILGFALFVLYEGFQPLN
jgi:threonine/homoserine/homoserine lactone efflux protein